MFQNFGKTALIAGAALAAAAQARADFSYSAAFHIDSVTAGANTVTALAGPGTVTGSGITIVNTDLSGTGASTTGGSTATVGGTTLTLQDVAPGLTFLVPTPVPVTINIGNVGATTTSPNSAADSFTVNYTDAVTIHNMGNPGSDAQGTFLLHGTFTLSNVSSNPITGSVTQVFTGPTSASGPLGGILFTGAAQNFANLTINGALTSSNLGGVISAVPEPSTVVLMGIGGVVLLAPVLRRKARVAS